MMILLFLRPGEYILALLSVVFLLLNESVIPFENRHYSWKGDTYI